MEFQEKQIFLAQKKLNPFLVQVFMISFDFRKNLLMRAFKLRAFKLFVAIFKDISESSFIHIWLWTIPNKDEVNNCYLVLSFHFNAFVHISFNELMIWFSFSLPDILCINCCWSDWHWAFYSQPSCRGVEYDLDFSKKNNMCMK